MGNRISLVVLSAPATEAGVAVGSWSTEQDLPFLWLGFVPAERWPEYADRVTAAVTTGEDGPSAADIDIDWPAAEHAYRSRLEALATTWPEFRADAERLLEDVTAETVGVERPMIRLQLEDLVADSWDDQDAVGGFLADVLADAVHWDTPDRDAVGGATGFDRAATVVGPHRTLLITGERDD